MSDVLAGSGICCSLSCTCSDVLCCNQRIQRETQTQARLTNHRSGTEQTFLTAQVSVQQLFKQLQANTQSLCDTDKPEYREQGKFKITISFLEDGGYFDVPIRVS